MPEDLDLKARLKKGYDYFWNLKPSKVTPKDVLWLHNWLVMLNKVKLDNPDPSLPLNSDDLHSVTKAIFS